MEEQRETGSCDCRYKDRTPQETVRVIRNILESRQIRTQEQWPDAVYGHCYSMRLNLAGTQIGQNGKGITRELAQASGYAEFLERLLTGKLYEGRMEPEGAALLPESGASLLQFDRLDHMQKLQLTKRLCKARYASNGCAAGNTAEEAMVQGLSEIVERHHSLLFFRENLTPPEIPESFWRQFPAVAQVADAIRREGRFALRLLDCSMGQEIPVACAVFRDLQTGRYGVRFGAHPVWEIAIERTLTELFQGRNCLDAALIQEMVPDGMQEYDLFHVSALVKNGTGAVRQKFLEGRPDFVFSGRNMQAGMADNRQLAAQMAEILQAQGLQIYIRDCSVEGFAVLQILIPGYSDLFADFEQERLHDVTMRDQGIQLIGQYSVGGETKQAEVRKETAEQAIMAQISYLWDKLRYPQENTLGYTMNLPLRDEVSRPAENVKLIICLLLQTGKLQTAAELLRMLLRAPGEGYRREALQQVLSRLETAMQNHRTFSAAEAWGQLGFACRNFHCESCGHREVCDYPGLLAALRGDHQDSR